MKCAFTWSMINTAVGVIAYKLRELDLKGIIAVPRGGLVPATMLSHRLKIPIVAYADKQTLTQWPLPVDANMYLGDGTGFLVVDEIADSLATYRALRTKLPSAAFAVLVHKQPLVAPEIVYCAAVPVGLWVEFPWEV